jgi:hypothetical protein
MSDEKVVKVRVESAGLGGMLWAAGWLFTIGYLHLAPLKILFAVVLWPYYIGVSLHA